MAVSNYPQSTFFSDVMRGKLPKYRIVHKFGHNESVGTTVEPICYGGVYPTPQVSGATTLRIKAGGDATDTAAGDGAREITLVGLDANGDEVTETLATNGASASSATTTAFLRLYRVYVSASGTYASSTAGSHTADITIEDSGGSADWATIEASNFPHGQSEIGAYSVPNGYRAFISHITIFIESAKPATIYLFQRPNILETSVPYSAMRVVYSIEGAAGQLSVPLDYPLGPFDAGTDIGFMGNVAMNSTQISVNFELLLEEV